MQSDYSAIAAAAEAKADHSDTVQRLGSGYQHFHQSRIRPYLRHSTAWHTIHRRASPCDATLPSSYAQSRY